MLFWLLLSVVSLVSPGAIALPTKGCKVLDLTHELSENTPYYPIYQPFNLTRSFAGPWGKVAYVEWNFICSYEHMGTHVDAPSHFSQTGKKIDQVALEAVIGEACVIDISLKVAEDKTYNLQIEDVREWEATNGELNSDSIVLLYTGQQHLYWDRKEYFGATNLSDTSTYRFSGV